METQIPQRSVLPEFDVFKMPNNAPLRTPRYGSGAVGKTLPMMLSPAAAALRGLGQDAAPAAAAEAAPLSISPLAAFAIIGIVGYFSYEIGSAIAPSGSKKSTWGLIGVPVGLFTGPLGLGAMAAYSNHWAR